MSIHKLSTLFFIMFFVRFSYAADVDNDVIGLLPNQDDQFYVIGEAETINIEINALLPQSNKEKKTEVKNTSINKNDDIDSKIKPENNSDVTVISSDLNSPPKPEKIIILNKNFNLANDNEVSKLKELVFSKSLNTHYTGNVSLPDNKKDKVNNYKDITLNDLKKERLELEKMKQKLIELQNLNFNYKDVSTSRVLSAKDFK